MKFELKSLEDGKPAHLRLHDGGIDLLRETLPALALAQHTHLRYESHFKGDSLSVAGQIYGIPYGKGSQVQAMLAQGRLNALVGPSTTENGPHTLPSGRLITCKQALYLQWIQGFLDPGELLLAYLEGGGELDIDSPIMDDAKGLPVYYLTQCRQGIVVISALGDIRHDALPSKAMSVGNSVGRQLISMGGLTWLTPLTSADLFREVAPISRLEANERLLEMSRLHTLADAFGKAQGLLDRLTNLGIAPLASLVVEAIRRKADLATLLSDSRGDTACKTLLTVDNPGPLLLSFTQDWHLSAPQNRALFHWSRRGSAQMALPLHRSIHQKQCKTSAQDATTLALLDLELGAHFLEVGQAEEAQTLLEARLPTLPDELLMDLLPLHASDLAQGKGGQALRIRVLEMLATARGETHTPNPETLLELAKLQPLVAQRMMALLAVCQDPPLTHRAETLLSLLQGNWPEKQQPPEPGEAPSALDADTLENVLQHPMTRSGGAFFTLQSWLGKARIPDVTAIQDYSERLTPSVSPMAFTALSRGLLVFGLPLSTEAFISRGERHIGIRAFGGERPFILIGATHLDPSSDYFLNRPEMEFALGAELAHLRFKHTRLTTSEVWDGVFDMGNHVVDTAVALIGPLGLLGKTLGGFAHLKRASSFLGGPLDAFRAGAEGAATLMGASKELRPKKKDKNAIKSDGVHDSRDGLLAFCRSLQLTADRAGLVLSGDIKSAFEAIMRTQARHLPVLITAQEMGLQKLLTYENTEGHALEQDLAVRLAALFSFYLSEDYVTLRDKLEAT